MRKIFTGIDIGTYEIKIVTLEFYNGKYNVLASTSVPSAGVKKGLIIDAVLVSASIKKGIKNIENKLGIKIDKVLAIVPSNNIEVEISEGSTTSSNIITGEIIFNCLQKSLKGVVRDNMEIVSAMPILYKINGNDKIEKPIGLSAETFTVKSILAMVPRKNVYSVVSILSNLGLEVIDICLASISNYEAVRTIELDKKQLSVVDIGYEKTTVSIFKKGLFVNETILQVGSKNIDSDIITTFDVNETVAREVKERFAVCNRKYADQNEFYDCKNQNSNDIKINQYKLADLIETRIIDILKNAKKEINNLTKNEIGYIIITGGITSMLGFGEIVFELYPSNVSVMNIPLIGIRNNKYGASYGIIKYFVRKLVLREKEYTMFSDEQVEEMMKVRKTKGANSVITKIFEKIFD